MPLGGLLIVSAGIDRRQVSTGLSVWAMATFHEESLPEKPLLICGPGVLTDCQEDICDSNQQRRRTTHSDTGDSRRCSPEVPYEVGGRPLPWFERSDGGAG